MCLTQKSVISVLLATLPTEQLTHLFKNVSIRTSEIVTGVLKTLKARSLRGRKSAVTDQADLIPVVFLSGCDC